MGNVDRNPLVSIIVPLYNTERYIFRCLESVRKQIYTNFECIIVNDGSTDCSKEVADQFVKSDKRYILYNKENGGLSSARNFGIEKAGGEFISFLDSDDYWLEDKLNAQINLLNQYEAKDKLVLFGKCFVEAESGVRSVFKDIPYANNPCQLLAYNSITGSGSAVLLHRSAFLKVGVFSTNLRSFEDLEFWQRISLSGYAFIYNPVPHVVILRRSNSLSVDRSTMMQSNIHALQLQLKWFLKTGVYSVNDILPYLSQRVKAARKYMTPGSLFSNLKSLLLLITVSFSGVLKLFMFKKGWLR